MNEGTFTDLVLREATDTEQKRYLVEGGLIAITLRIPKNFVRNRAVRATSGEIKKNLGAIGMSSEIIPAKPGDIVLYQTAQGNPEIECVFHGENMWLTQAQMVELYQVSKSSISEHVKHIFEEGELDPNSVVRKFRTTAAD